MQQVLDSFRPAAPKSVDEAPETLPANDYLTRRKGVEPKDKHLTKTKKEEQIFDCLEMECEPTERESHHEGFRTLSSPLLGGFMITDFKGEYELPQHHCTEFN